MQPFITLEIPPADFGALATAAALDGLDLTRWVKRKIKTAAQDGTLARIATARRACNAQDATTAADAAPAGTAADCCPPATAAPALAPATA